MNREDDCHVEPHRLVGLLAEDVDGTPDELADHVRDCGSCRRELQALRGSWEGMPSSVAVSPPEGLREQLLEEAREAVSSPVVQLARVWSGLRRAVLAVGLGAAGAGILVFGLGFRGHLTATDPVVAAWLSVILAAGLGVIGFGLMEEGAGPGLRGLLAASLATFAGYAGLNLLHPLPQAVDFCRVSLLGAGELSTGSLCLIYLGVAALYAGAPAGLAAWRWDGHRPPWAMALLVAAVVAVLAVPFHGLQLGTANVAVTLSALLGLGAGALAGALAGSLLRHRVGLSG